MKRYLRVFLFTAAFAALITVQASALEYDVAAPEDHLFARPTSQDIIYTEEPVNVNRSKDVALDPPGFGTPTSYLPGSGEYLTPNLVPGAMDGGLVSAVGGAGQSVSSSGVPTMAEGSSELIISYPAMESTPTTTSFTEVTPELYYSGGHLGTLKIPSLGVNVKIYEGTDSAALAKGAGHFPGTSIWAGNVSIAGHNRGENCYFGSIHTLQAGELITLTTRLGTRTYSVTSVSKVSETDASGTAATPDNQITLYTCVRNESAYRWCVKGVEVQGHY